MYPVALVLSLLVAGQTGADHGLIRGVVREASPAGAALGNIEVILRVEVDGQFVPAAQTISDADGSFQFTGLPVDAQYVYLPGANLGGIHYPGARVRLTEAQPRADVLLAATPPLTGPNPLVILQQEIDLQTAPGVLRVRERLIIDNPTRSTYVGRAEGGQEQPVTLQLNIPADFQRVTFDHEFFGRRFSVVDGKLVTGIPWTPGRRELAFTYTLRNQDTCRVWLRPLDLPCQQLSLRVDHHTPARSPPIYRRYLPPREADPGVNFRGSRWPRAI